LGGAYVFVERYILLSRVKFTLEIPCKILLYTFV
jgi:hypothetical protein